MMNRTIESPETVGLNSKRLQRIRPMMQSLVDQGRYAGVSTLLARRGKLIHAEQVGWQNRAQQIPLGPDTIFRLYSMTKPVVCTAFMTLFEEGRLQLTDPVAKYLPAFGKLRVLRGNSTGDTQMDLLRPITLRDLLTHTAGLAYGLTDETPVDALYRQARLPEDGSRSLEAMIDALASLPLAYQPGAIWYYSVSIDVIAHLIQVISGKPLQDFLAERLFRPLGMLDTAFHVPSEKRSRLSAIYASPDNPQAGQAAVDSVDLLYPVDNTTTFARGGNGLFGTAWDYLRFAQMLLQRGELDGARILAPKIIDLMHRNHLPPTLLPYVVTGNLMSGYGFGLGSRVLMSVAESAVPGSAGEFGWAGAANTYYWVDPQEELVGLFMAQALGSTQFPEKIFQTLVYAAMTE
jgi:CubicO group peptidase (beta-lactamase class C family)